MLFYALSTFSFAAFGLSASGEYTLPVTTCKRDSVDYSACLKRAIEEAWPRFTAGLPELDFPTLDPLFYEHVEVSIKLGDIRGRVIVENVTVIGALNAFFYDVRTHFLDNVFRLEIDLEMPNLSSEGAVDVVGTLNVFRFSGKGHFNVTAESVSGTWDLIGPVVNDTWIVEHFHAVPSVKKLQVYFDNLLGQSKEINDAAVSFVNEYWPAIYRAMLPLTVKLWDPWLTIFPNKIFSKVSFSKVFP